eukprot:902210-Prorocentrum_minimum.AAC.1
MDLAFSSAARASAVPDAAGGGAGERAGPAGHLRPGGARAGPMGDGADGARAPGKLDGTRERTQIITLGYKS